MVYSFWLSCLPADLSYLSFTFCQIEQKWNGKKPGELSKWITELELLQSICELHFPRVTEPSFSAEMTGSTYLNRWSCHSDRAWVNVTDTGNQKMFGSNIHSNAHLGLNFNSIHSKFWIESTSSKLPLIWSDWLFCNQLPLSRSPPFLSLLLIRSNRPL